MAQILLVEDMPEFQLMVTRSLARHQVTCVASVDAGLMELRGKKFDLLLLDLSLPERDGYALLEEIEKDPSLGPIPVICLTGKHESEAKAAAFKLGVDDYIVKPFDVKELQVRVDSRLARR